MLTNGSHKVGPGLPTNGSPWLKVAPTHGLSAMVWRALSVGNSSSNSNSSMDFATPIFFVFRLGTNTLLLFFFHYTGTRCFLVISSPEYLVGVGELLFIGVGSLS